MKKTSKLLIVLCIFITAFTVGCSTDKEEELPKFKVTFESNGGSTVGTQEIEAGSKVTKPTDPTKEDAVFGGWFADQDLTTAWDFAKDVVVDNNITLYAKWTSQYTVVFNAKGGSPTPDTQKVEAGSIIVRSADPTMENGIFLGWYTDETFEKEWNFNTDVVTANLFLFAKWTMNCVITFDAQGGEPTPPQQDVKDGERITEPTPEPTKEGYRFEGWNTEADGNGSSWNFNSTVYSSKTLYARWEKTITYTITFETNGAEEEIEPQKVPQGNQATEPKTPVKEGFAFGEWYNDEELTDKYDFETYASEDKTLYAKWVANDEEFQVTFIIQNPIDGEETKTMKTVTAGSKLTEPDVPEVEGYKFSHWLNTTTYENKEWDFENDLVTSNIELSAIYEKLYYVVFDANGGTPTPATQTVVEGELIDKPTEVKNGDKTIGATFLLVTGDGPGGGWIFKDTVSGKHYEVSIHLGGNGGSNWNDAKTLAATYRGGGWYLPNKELLNEIHRATSDLVANGFPAYQGWFWSSSQVNNDEAWVHHFYVDLQTKSCKTLLSGVLAVRAFNP